MFFSQLFAVLMIQVANLVRKFAGVTAVDNVSFNVTRGQITGILGPNGAGKTTTLRILSGYLAPTRGQVTIDGLALGEHSVEIRRRIGYLPENVPLYPEMRVREYLSFRARLKGVPRTRLAGRLEAVRSMCGLEAVFNRIIGQLSRGHWQRIGLADSLIHEPRLLILDEPTIGLDPNQIRAIREMIRALAGRYTVILSTHFLNEAEMVCQQVLILHQGRIIASDSPENLAGRLAGHICLTVEINAPPEIAAPEFSRLPGVRRVASHPAGSAAPEAGADALNGNGWHHYLLDCESQADLRPAVFNAARERGWILRELHSERKNLEAIFTTLTTNTPIQN